MPTIPDLLTSAARRAPDREALVFGDRRMTWSELNAEVDRVAGLLNASGVAQSDRVAILAPNGDGFVIAFFAALRAGAIAVPVNSRLAGAEVAFILDDAGAQLLVFAPSLAATVRAAGPACRLACLGASELAEDLLATEGRSVTSPPTETITEDDDAIIMYTSGTTGQPKGVLLDHRRAVWAALSEIASLGLRDGERYLHLAPLYHSGGVVFLVTTTLLAGTHVIIGQFSPRALLDAIERERCTFFLAVPTMFAFLLREPDLAVRDLSSWRLSVFGAAPMPRETLGEMLAEFPEVELVQLCGQTEGGPGGIYSTAAQVRQRPEATGRQAMVFYESRVMDTQDRDVGAGEVGELVLRGPGVMKGYWGRPQDTAATIREGWLHTGDLVRLDAEGYMTIVDRLKDVIITGGQNVYSAEVEKAIADHPAVADCAVIGRPHADYGESIVAVIVPATGAQSPSVEELRAFCARTIARYKAPPRRGLRHRDSPQCRRQGPQARVEEVPVVRRSPAGREPIMHADRTGDRGTRRRCGSAAGWGCRLPVPSHGRRGADVRRRTPPSSRIRRAAGRPGLRRSWPSRWQNTWRSRLPAAPAPRRPRARRPDR